MIIKIINNYYRPRLFFQELKKENDLQEGGGVHEGLGVEQLKKFVPDALKIPGWNSNMCVVTEMVLFAWCKF